MNSYQDPDDWTTDSSLARTYTPIVDRDGTVICGNCGKTWSHHTMGAPHWCEEEDERPRC